MGCSYGRSSAHVPLIYHPNSKRLAPSTASRMSRIPHARCPLYARSPPHPPGARCSLSHSRARCPLYARSPPHPLERAGFSRPPARDAPLASSPPPPPHSTRALSTLYERCPLSHSPRALPPLRALAPSPPRSALLPLALPRHKSTLAPPTLHVRYVSSVSEVELETHVRYAGYVYLCVSEPAYRVRDMAYRLIRFRR